MKKILKTTAFLLLIIILFLVIWIFGNLRDRNRGYSADLKILNNPPSALSAGFAAIPITPQVPDSWTDANGDAKYDPGDGDTYTDINGNGKFDPVWIAGFHNGRAANGIHDELWARTMVISDGRSRLAIVALDAIGFMNNEVISVRERLPEELGISYLIVTSTHSHEVPDLLGLWGRSPFRSGVNPDYLEYVKGQIVRSVEEAARNIRPVTLEISEDITGASHMVKDTREPLVSDSGLRLIRAVDQKTGATAGTIIAWANHPETLWSKNLLITSDFPHYVREYVEKGIYSGDSLLIPGTGGTALYINGAVGGLMTTHPDIAVRDPFTGKEYKEPSFEKAEAQGKQLAMIALSAMEKPVASVKSATISLIARTVILPINNRLFRLATSLGVLKRGTTGWMKMRSEVSVFNIGPLSFATLPGEVYPEIINGGVEKPDGGDFAIDPVEVPAIRDMMKGKYRFIFGLANDEMGYIIPKSQWDAEAPFAYGKDHDQYGEENSLGPETAPILHSNLKEMLEELNKSTNN